MSKKKQPPADYECPKHPDSKRDLEERQRLRREGLLNKPIKGNALQDIKRMMRDGVRPDRTLL